MNGYTYAQKKMDASRECEERGGEGHKRVTRSRSWGLWVRGQEQEREKKMDNKREEKEKGKRKNIGEKGKGNIR